MTEKKISRSNLTRITRERKVEHFLTISLQHSEKKYRNKIRVKKRGKRPSEGSNVRTVSVRKWRRRWWHDFHLYDWYREETYRRAPLVVSTSLLLVVIAVGSS